MSIHSGIRSGRPDAVEAEPADQAGPALVDPQRVAAARSHMPDAGDIADTADVLGMLSDPGRLKMLVALREGELCVGDLTAVAGGSPSGVSHALQLLRAHRVVAARRSEEHTSELQSRGHLVCRLLLEKKKHEPTPGA